MTDSPPTARKRIAVDLRPASKRKEDAMTKHVIDQLCPLCEVTFLQHVHCVHSECTFLITTCPKCDREQVVREFVLDHESDCEHRETVPFLRQKVT